MTSIEEHIATASALKSLRLLISPSGETIPLSTGYIPLLTDYTLKQESTKKRRKQNRDVEKESPNCFSALELVRDNQFVLLVGPSGSEKQPTTTTESIGGGFIKQAFIKLLILGESSVVKDWILDTKITRQDILPLLKSIEDAQIAISLFHQNPILTEPIIHSWLVRLRDVETQSYLHRLKVWLRALNPLHQRVSNHILAIIKEGTLTITQRLKAGRALSQLGDPRDLTALTTVPSNTFTIDSSTYPNSSPPHSVAIPSYQIGVFPVVNRDYAIFIQETGRKWNSPDSSSPSKEHFPATDITWYDARAYCSWLTTRWQTSGKITLDEEVHLPTEPEWEIAARGSRILDNETESMYP
ncbi:hypothetical protein BOTCAL_0059g00370 [Botryotinia calthae]|uniref:Sulfatase-modifying factor enzyme-like domain-containing protein n=1 Tax=Botryotinia calthae TaxID=38488 RepID=A0A4Y8DA32_9HELO|nr:hypothetical protein BOTCAL_0059g00370 [Botryotinia calthae]